MGSTCRGELQRLREPAGAERHSGEWRERRWPGQSQSCGDGPAHLIPESVPGPRCPGSSRITFTSRGQPCRVLKKARPPGSRRGNMQALWGAWPPYSPNGWDLSPPLPTTHPQRAGRATSQNWPLGASSSGLSAVTLLHSWHHLWSSPKQVGLSLDRKT